MIEPYVARLRAPHFPTRWYVLADDPERRLETGATVLKGWGPFRTQRDAEVSRRRLAEGGPAVDA